MYLAFLNLSKELLQSNLEQKITKMADTEIMESFGHQESYAFDQKNEVTENQQQNRSFSPDPYIRENQICRHNDCHCDEIQQKLKAIEARIKKLVLNFNNDTVSEEDIESRETSKSHVKPQIRTNQNGEQTQSVHLKEERLSLANLSQKIEAIVQKQRQQGQIITKICAEKQNCFAFYPTAKEIFKRQKVEATIVSPNLKKTDSQILEQMFSDGLSMGGNKLGQSIDKKSEKSDLSASITSQRHQQINQMTEEEKNVAYANKIKQDKLLAKMKRKHR